MKGITITELEAWRDARGWNTHPLDEDVLRGGGFANLHVVSIEPGAVRGNHVHRRQTERVLIIGGPCLFVASDPESGEKLHRVINPGELFLITIQPGTPHAFKNTGKDVCYLLCAGEFTFDPDNPDTERYELPLDPA